MARELTGFPPILGPAPRVLVLGSMPSAASLAQRQYYGHPRNAFWPIMAQLFGWPADLPYPERCTALAEREVALWDVIARCAREGSADTAIDAASVVVNPIAELLGEQPTIGAILFNGGTAAREFRRHIGPALSARPVDLPQHQLPSTSPAMARLTLAQKAEAWRILLELLGDG
ncbi:DNA-deoxyinosine glycosylase [Thiorhodovibrio frisius]|uniref:G:T/U mismatch-specific DNA glycosylase n=1 Tax=Thiorhodovibrio frisius TaxID=631362 RepID=H8Z5M4_9GAMM|nr:DNA-deoxyinosine glycosylase [Thiorhodovibrio frisius]EIC20594.1 G:T/U mismatch-specific DNA glycosylase [Thiorhodovibrio frisius]WPL21343.1 DNA-deoxyinosine glycosylase [Thiorhodovibrio frisius]